MWLEGGNSAEKSGESRINLSNKMLSPQHLVGKLLPRTSAVEKREGWGYRLFAGFPQALPCFPNLFMVACRGYRAFLPAFSPGFPQDFTVVRWRVLGEPGSLPCHSLVRGRAPTARRTVAISPNSREASRRSLQTSQSHGYAIILLSFICLV